jgi:hypothetical protein
MLSMPSLINISVATKLPDHVTVTNEEKHLGVNGETTERAAVVPRSCGLVNFDRAVGLARPAVCAAFSPARAGPR